jgi:hypothetical protein
MIGEKMIRGVEQGVYQIPENDNDEGEGGPRGQVTE